MSTVLLVEELRFRRRRGGVLWVFGSRREPGVVAGREGGQGRPEAARRGSLDGSGCVLGMMGGEARQGFLVAVRSWWLRGLHGDGDGTQLGLLQVPKRVRGRQRRSSGAGHPFAALWRHGVVRPQPGGLNQTRDLAPNGGVMTPRELAPWLRPSWLTRRLGPGSGFLRRAGRRRRG